MLFRHIKWWPLILAEAYLVSTFILVWAIPSSKLIENPLTLTLFLFFAFGAIALGYWIGLRINRNEEDLYVHSMSSKSVTLINLLVFLSASHILLFAYSQLKEYEITSLSTLISNLRNMGQAYSDKFSIYNNQIITGARNHITQMLTLCYVLYYFAWPLTLAFWDKINIFIKLYSLFSIIPYTMFFLATGTQMGLLNVVLLMSMAMMLRGARLLTFDLIRGRRFVRRMIITGATMMLVFVVLMGIMQQSRSMRFGVSGRFESEASTMAIANVIGTQNASSVLMVISYPTNGYIGLAYCLDMPFVWCQGRVWSYAIGSYLNQYLGWDDNFDKSYMARSEVSNGWPALMYWSTAYAWIASDITFIGAIFLMLPIGMLMSWAWLRAINHADLYAILIGLQVSIFVAYIPANNQIFHSRTGTWAAVFTLAFLPIYFFTRESAGRPARRKMRPPPSAIAIGQQSASSGVGGADVRK